MTEAGDALNYSVLLPTVNNQPFIEKTIEGRDLQQLTHLRDYKYHSLRKCDTQH